MKCKMISHSPQSISTYKKSAIECSNDMQTFLLMFTYVRKYVRIFGRGLIACAKAIMRYMRYLSIGLQSPNQDQILVHS